MTLFVFNDYQIKCLNALIKLYGTINYIDGQTNNFIQDNVYHTTVSTYLNDNLNKKIPSNSHIVYFNNTHLLQQYVENTAMCETTTVNIVRLITFIKNNQKNDATFSEYIKEFSGYILILTDFLYNYNLKNVYILSKFINKPFKINTCIKAPLLNYSQIKNWEKIVNQLSTTDLYKFVK